MRFHLKNTEKTIALLYPIIVFFNPKIKKNLFKRFFNNIFLTCPGEACGLKKYIFTSLDFVKDILQIGLINVSFYMKIIRSICKSC